MLIEQFYYIVSSYPQSPQAEQSPKLFPTSTSWHTSKHLLSVPFLRLWNGTKQIKKSPMIEALKYRSRQLLTAITDFLSPLKIFKKKTGFTWNLQPPRHTVQGVFFEINPLLHICGVNFSKNISMPQVRVDVREYGNDVIVLWDWP